MHFSEVFDSLGAGMSIEREGANWRVRILPAYNVKILIPLKDSVGAGIGTIPMTVKLNGGMLKIYKNNTADAGWVPATEDLIADDWQIIDETVEINSTIAEMTQYELPPVKPEDKPVEQDDDPNLPILIEAYKPAIPGKLKANAKDIQAAQGMLWTPSYDSLLKANIICHGRYAMDDVVLIEVSCPDTAAKIDASWFIVEEALNLLN